MNQTSDRIALERSHLQAFSLEQLEKLTNVLLNHLGNPGTGDQQICLQRLKDQQWDECKRLCLCDPCDSYLAALSCIASAWRSPTIAESVLRDAARHVADFAKIRSAQTLANEFGAIIRGVN